MIEDHLTRAELAYLYQCRNSDNNIRSSVMDNQDTGRPTKMCERISTLLESDRPADRKMGYMLLKEVCELAAKYITLYRTPKP